MAEKMSLAVPAMDRIPVQKLVKRTFEVLVAMALTSAVVFLVLMGNTMLVGKGTSAQGFALWLAFIKRPDILTMMALTSLITVTFVAGGRAMERR